MGIRPFVAATGLNSSITSWICRSCRVRAQRYHSSQPPPPEKPYFVTTPIFYVNAAPHLGHLHSLVIADIFKRWAALREKNALLCTGTDEHGLKVQQAAAKARQDVRAFCDKNSQAFFELAIRAEVHHDHFTRTSEPEHHLAVQHFWLMLNERGYIYTSKHEGWYSISDETFYPQSAVHLSLDPPTGRKIMVSIETGNEVEWTSESNYHFRLSAFKDRLLEFYENNPQFIIPSTRMNEVIAHVRSGLNDLSISRPVERLSWGIPVPNDPSQTIYVWLDALINYLTKTNYPFEPPGREDAAGWPADIHVIGKDIVRFHAIYWPAFLMALDLPLPRQIFAHAHWTLGRRKMSKSRGNVVNPFFAIHRFGIDALRYFLALKGGVKDDAVYDNDLVSEQYEMDLKCGLGNLSSRIIRGKGWNVFHAVQQQKIPLDEDSLQLAQLLNELPSVVLDKIENQLDLGSALQSIMNVVRKTNKYMQQTSPWTLVKQNPAEPNPKLDRIIYLCAESVRVVGILLQPFMPSKMERLLDTLGVNPDARSFQHATRQDRDFGAPSDAYNIGRGTQGALFPPLRFDG